AWSAGTPCQAQIWRGGPWLTVAGGSAMPFEWTSTRNKRHICRRRIMGSLLGRWDRGKRSPINLPVALNRSHYHRSCPSKRLSRLVRITQKSPAGDVQATSYPAVERLAPRVRRPERYSAATLAAKLWRLCSAA